MKKISTLILTFLGSLAALHAQSVAFTYGGEVLQNGATVEYYADETGYADTNEPKTLEVTNSTAGPAAISVTVRKVDPSDAMLIWCGITTQCQPMAKRSETRTATVEAGQSKPLMLDAQFSEYGTWKASATLTVNGETQVVNINFIYSEEAGIASPLAGTFAYSGNSLTYSFDTPAERQLTVCNVAGQTVKSQPVGLSGTTSLADLPAGLYIARIVSGGKTVATRKCLVK